MIAPKTTFNFMPRSLSKLTTAQIIFAGYLVIIIMVILMKNMNRGNSLFALFNDMAHVDKVAHFLLFGLLTYSLSFAIKHRRLKLMTINIPLAPIIMLAATFMEECSQIVLESRTFSLLDMFANVLGVTCFGFMALAFTRRRNVRSDL